MAEDVVTFHMQSKTILRVLIKEDWDISFGLQDQERFIDHLNVTLKFRI